MKTTHLLCGVALLATIPGCDRTDTLGPPQILIGDSMCAECGMIISDERYATATLYPSSRGTDAMLFDDFNCQRQYETAHIERVPSKRWSHDYATLEWFETENAYFALSEQLRTPMGSGVAAFASKESAIQFAQSINGVVQVFNEIWNVPSEGTSSNHDGG
ncbi:MAG: nitrous oxide reductase accessory protein NosL [Phycisphaeraceae bacterium]|nr:nitrous oxide reductase accessory protein NosL [Phycisphaerales bacterium]MCB9858843.1 nitrous oxide reductase accessory protein NosL [Phycisphaeraceae bacterium]